MGKKNSIIFTRKRVERVLQALEKEDISHAIIMFVLSVAKRCMDDNNVDECEHIWWSRQDKRGETVEGFFRKVK